MVAQVNERQSGANRRERAADQKLATSMSDPHKLVPNRRVVHDGQGWIGLTLVVINVATEQRLRCRYISGELFRIGPAVTNCRCRALGAVGRQEWLSGGVPGRSGLRFTDENDVLTGQYKLRPVSRSAVRIVKRCPG